VIRKTNYRTDEGILVFLKAEYDPRSLPAQGIGVYFQILEKQAKLKIFLTATSKKSKKF
jgi:hypothetical protein